MHLLFVFAFVFASFADEEDPDVHVLTEDNFEKFISNEFVLVEFYAPWCGHCKKLAPEYSRAATALKASGSPVLLGKVDATVESALGEKFGVRGYPTLKFFRGGEPIEYEGGRTEAEIINWVTKKSGPPSKTLGSQTEIDNFLKSAGTRALAYASGDNEAVWSKVASSEKTQAFAFAHVADSALFGGKADGTAELHKEGEDVKTHSGDFTADSIINWVVSEGFPLVDELSQDSWTRAQTAGLDLLAIFQTARDNSAGLDVAKAYKGNLVVTTSDQVGIATRWGSSGNVVPTVIYVSNKDGNPSFTIWNEETNAEVNTETLKAFVEGARDGSYESYIKSEPIPEDNDGPVTVLVGKNFEQIVFDKKDVLVEFYAPWCGHCKKLAPVFDELGEAFKSDDNIVIAKMDATANGSPKGVSISGFPTIIFWDANNKQSSYDGERDLDSFKAWIEANRASSASGAEKVDL